MVSGQAVDLTKLFQWWTNHYGPRPLTAWVHVSGPVVGTNAWGWVLDAEVEAAAGHGAGRNATGGKLKILLKNPPVRERAEFDKLVARLRELESDRATFSQQEANAKKQASHIASQQKSYHRKPSRSAILGQEAAQNDEAINQDQKHIKELDKQLQELRGKLAAYPNPNSYLVDCLALDIGQDHNGMPLFDHGLVLH
jgi:hypothetical protein